MLLLQKVITIKCGKEYLAGQWKGHFKETEDTWFQCCLTLAQVC